MKIYSTLLGLALATSTLVAAPRAALAKDSKAVVSSLTIDETNYQGLRVKLQGVSSFCDGGATSPQVAYLALNHPLYDTIVKLVTSAFLAGKQITIRATYDASTSQYCRIFGVTMD